MKLILLGPPAAGKGTQAECIAERYSLAHISTGDMLRAEIALKTPLGMQAKTLIDDGLLVPDDMINEMVFSRVLQDDCSVGFLLDGYPRTLAQASALSERTKIDAVIDIAVDADTLIERVARRRVCPSCRHSQTVIPDSDAPSFCSKCGTALIQRDDDNPESVRHRLDVYYRETYPLIRYYKEQGLLVEVDGSKEITAVSEQIFSFIDSNIGGRK